MTHPEPAPANLEDSITEAVLSFMGQAFLFGAGGPIDREASLLESGLIDSTGVLDLIGFLEGTYGIRFADEELVASNFDTVSRIASFLAAKLRSSKSPAA